MLVWRQGDEPGFFPDGKVSWGHVSLARNSRTTIPLPPDLQRFYWMRLSPDERWLAYHSEESDGLQVYVVDFAGFTNRMRVSRGDGSHPEWHPNGRELFFLGNDRRTMRSARWDGERRRFDEPVKLFDLPESIFNDYPWRFSLFDVAPDGPRFLMLAKVPEAMTTNQIAAPNVRFVENWFEEYRGKR